MVSDGGADGVVVVAAHGDRAVVDEAHHGLDRPFRIGAISDDIAEADDPLRAARPRRLEAGAERLPVGVDIRKDRQTHLFLRVHDRADQVARGLMDIKQQGGAARNDDTEGGDGGHSETDQRGCAALRTRS